MVSKLQYISQEPHLLNIQDACEAGCDWIQLRVKNISEPDYIAFALEAKGIADRFGAKLIINDSLKVALEVGAYGVHLGKKDMDLAEARKIAGKDLVIGGSTNSLKDILLAANKAVDYLGLGPFRHTTTKTDLNPILGLDGIAKIMEGIREHKVMVPIIAIGGIQLSDVSELMLTGVYGVAVSGAITSATNKEDIVRGFQRHF